MDLYPQDLGDKIGQQVRRQRLPPSDAESSASTATLAALCFGSLVATILTGLAQLPEITAIFLLATVLTAFLWVSAVRREQESGEGRVADHEIAQLRDSVQDPLARSYLKLVRTVLSVPALPGASAEQEIRSAVSALGTALDSLPQPEMAAVGPVSVERAPLAERRHLGHDHGPDAGAATDDPMALQADAGRLTEKAQGETDPVIRASLQRRAESLTRRAETAARTLTLLRRNQALREEIGEQIDALRTNLTAFRVGGKQSAPDFAGLAASIQRVTMEANAITVARAEIDTLLAETPRPSVANEAQGQRVGLR